MCDGNCEGCCNKEKYSERLYNLTENQLHLIGDSLEPKGKPISLVVQNPSNGATLEHLLQKFFKNKSALIPKGANAYCASDFSGYTQHMRKDENQVEKMFSVYAVQFYRFDANIMV